MLTNFEWLCRDYPDYVKALMCGEERECFVKLDPNVTCECSYCYGLWGEKPLPRCQEKFKKWLDERCEK